MLDLLGYPSLIVGRVIALVVALTIHEFAHALAARQLGDRTAEQLGRLTLNPLAHLDPIGSLMLIIGGFGWAKPVPVNPYNLRGTPRRSMALVAAAGPLSNILQAFVFATPMRFGLLDFHPGAFSTEYLVPGAVIPSIELVLSLLIWINLLLAVFNLIPLGPLDGMKALLGVVPDSVASMLEPINRYGGMLLLALLVFGGDILGLILITPAFSLLSSVLGYIQ
ncbi:MAG: site-2 protease family protein [Chloroflexota bacterium]